MKGDVRDREELSAIEGVDALIECSAEPSVLAGADGETAYTVHTNLMGAYNCLEICRRDGAQLIFLSTSRVYPMRPQSELTYEEEADPLRALRRPGCPRRVRAGISEDFPLEGARSLYGATKLAAELLIEEYAAGFGLRTVIDRCGVITGPVADGQGRPGSLRLLALPPPFRPAAELHRLRRRGKAGPRPAPRRRPGRPRRRAARRPDGWAGFVGNVGGGRDHSLSLLETTEICRELTGNEVPIERVAETRRDDVPIFIADCARLFERTDWRPRRDPRRTLSDIHEWTVANESSLAEALGLDAAARVN